MKESGRGEAGRAGSHGAACVGLLLGMEAAHAASAVSSRCMASGLPQQPSQTPFGVPLGPLGGPGGRPKKASGSHAGGQQVVVGWHLQLQVAHSAGGQDAQVQRARICGEQYTRGERIKQLRERARACEACIMPG